MQLRHLLCASAVSLVAALVTPAALAQDCVGFTDVVDDGPGGFCPNVEWLKNRSITLGCNQQGTLYCPGTDVTRLGMAAFMNRLGTALTPVFIRKRQSSTTIGGLDYASLQTVCATDPFTITGFPRSVILTAMLNLFTPGSSFDARAQLVYSTDNGASWLGVPDGDGFAYGALYQNVPGTSTAFAPPNDISLRPLTFMDLNVGSTYRFAVQGLRINGASGPAVAQTECELHAQVVNRNGTSSPRDLPPPEPPRGP